jgi:hypothetical protein
MQPMQVPGVSPLRGAKEAARSEPGGWLWVVLGLVGVGGLGVAIAYGNSLWSHRRKDRAMRQKRDEVVRENYRRGG